jgi:hypothetical protein
LKKEGEKLGRNKHPKVTFEVSNVTILVTLETSNVTFGCLLKFFQKKKKKIKT